jgi:tryptophan halogenase
MLFEYLELKDSDWMSSCNATYKSSIRFENFYKKGRYFHYPFGPSRTDIDPKRWFILKEVYPEIFTPERASSYLNPYTILCEENKLCNENNYLKNCTAYHFDSYLFGEYLRKYSEKRGVEVIDDTFLEANLKDDGSIESIVCENAIYEADLFVDCSGFKSLLLGGVMEEEYISYDKTLINNKALATKVPYKHKKIQLKNYTNCVALNNGWVWETPLWDCLAYGYVHTNKFSSDKDIEQEFFNHIGEEVDYKVVNFKTGRYRRGWVKNVVAVGLSYGFVEPLESSGIGTTLENGLRLLECLSKRDMYYAQVDRDVFNRNTSHFLDSFRTFLDLHYCLSSRNDSEYWRYVTENIDSNNSSYNSFISDLILGKELGNNTQIDLYGNEFFGGEVFLVAGMNYSCHQKHFILKGCDKNDFKLKKECSIFEEYLRGLKSSITNFSSSYDYLKKEIYSKE